MTDRTANRGYSFPECEPPLVKDRSDIGFLRDLAQQVNADMDALDARVVALIEKPDAARIAFAGNLTLAVSTSGDAIFTVPYNSTTYSQPANFSDTVGGGLRVRERGFYMITSYVRATNAGLVWMQLRNLRNGFGFTEGRRFEGPSWPVTSGLDSSMTTSDIIVCDAGNLLQTQVKMSAFPPGTYAFEARLSAIQVLPLDI